MSKKLPCCESCGWAFRPDPYNAHRQRCCTRPDCLRERKRKRQRKSYAKRYREDPVFRGNERQRCAAGIRSRRAAGGMGRDGPGAETVPVMVFELLAGLVSEQKHTSDAAEVRAVMREYEARGRRLTGTDPP